MENPYTCDNCLFNPTQYYDIGTVSGICLKHDCLLRASLHTTCHFLRRKDLPFFLAQEGEAEHADDFPRDAGIVFYHGRHPVQIKKYSERHVWITKTYDPFVHEAALYHRTEKKWTFIQAFAASRNPIKSLMASSLTRGYVRLCGPEQDNFRLVLSVVNDLKERLDLHEEDFRWEISQEELPALREHYLKEIKLLQLYAVQEYGAITNNDDVMWIADELNGSLFSSWRVFLAGVRELVPLISSYIIESAQKRGTFFPETGDAEIEEETFFSVDQA